MWSEKLFFFMHAKRRLSSLVGAFGCVCKLCVRSIYVIDGSVVSYRYVTSGIANVQWFLLMICDVASFILQLKNWPEFRIGKTAQDGCPTGNWTSVIVRASCEFQNGCIWVTQSTSLGYDTDVETPFNLAVGRRVAYLLPFLVKLRVLNVVAAAVCRLRGTD
jgi:hypothetical protein